MGPLVLLCGWVSILGSLVLKLPQIFAVVRSGSADGLSLQSLLLECTAFTVNFCYNAGHGYPLDSYFEYALLIPQDVLLIVLTLRLSGRLTVGWVTALLTAAAVAAGLASGAAPLSALKLLLSCALPIGFSSKIVQLRAILGSKDARAVSLTTWLLAALTCLTRIVTTLAETQDTTLLTSFSVHLVLNSLVAMAAFTYRNGPATKVDGVKKTE
ncbi:solute carrier family 66 member 3-like [Amphibalanus amphitrite]|uniref:solute carrier family 66 member 3-like n=1 Tax=Amphibalanus amphitrite TaxID=1232801 RepID=UPI001C902E4E|nr:solute carrier family 66 member 3-like [Amphibalanus amphitrite]